MPLRLALRLSVRSWGNVRGVRRVVDEAARVLFPETYPNVCVAVSVVSPARMAALNEEHRGITKATDVLAFPFEVPEELREAHARGALGAMKDLGDIVICPEYIKAQCKEAGWTLVHRVPAILVHGMCHLAGHTHYAPDKAREMFAMEERILQAYAERSGLGDTFRDMYAPLTTVRVNNTNNDS